MSGKPNSTDLDKWMDKRVRVKFQGGREGAPAEARAPGWNCVAQFLLFLLTVVGTLKGYDQLINIVLDDTVEYLRVSDDEAPGATGETRSLGLLVCRGPQITVLCPDAEFKEIANPFVDDAAAGEEAA